MFKAKTKYVIIIVIIIFIVFLVLYKCCNISFAREIFVSINGNDNNFGTLKNPVQSLSRAIQIVRDLKQNSKTGDERIAIWLREGNYDLVESIFINDFHGGNKNPIVIGGYKNETIRITGGKRLFSNDFYQLTENAVVWDRLDSNAKGEIYALDLKKAGINDFGVLKKRGYGINGTSAAELYYNFERMVLSRWPDTNEDTVKRESSKANISIFEKVKKPSIGKRNYTGFRSTFEDDFDFRASGLGKQDIVSGFATVTEKISDMVFKFDNSRIDKWKNADDIWVHGYFKTLWSDFHIGVNHIDFNNRNIVLLNKPSYGTGTGDPIYFENLLEEITDVGEWYIDRKTGTLYFLPPPNFKKSEIYLSMLNNLIEIKNSSWLAFENIIFEYGRSTLIKVDGKNITFNKCVFRNSGSKAIELIGEENGIENSIIKNTGEAGIVINGGNRVNLKKGNNFVRNCDISKFSLWSFTYQPGINLIGVGNEVSHNRIYDGTHSAILFTGNENTIEYNEIFNVCNFTVDAGAIYSGRDWAARGNVIRYNFIHDIESKFDGLFKQIGEVNGVYLDDCLSGISVLGNIFYRVSGVAIYMSGGRDNKIENNIILNSRVAFYADNRGLNIKYKSFVHGSGNPFNMLEKMLNLGIKYQQPPWSDAYPELAAIPNDWNVIGDKSKGKWLHPEGCTFTRNIGYKNYKWISENNYGGHETLLSFKEVANNLEIKFPSLRTLKSKILN